MPQQGTSHPGLADVRAGAGNKKIVHIDSPDMFYRVYPINVADIKGQSKLACHAAQTSCA
jgi:hypothetical protein